MVVPHKYLIGETVIPNFEIAQWDNWSGVILQIFPTGYLYMKKLTGKYPGQIIVLNPELVEKVDV